MRNRSVFPAADGRIHGLGRQFPLRPQGRPNRRHRGSGQGAAQRTDSGTEALWLPEGHQRVRVERWYYKSGDRRLERIVLLYRGEVVAVRTGSR